MGIGLLPWERLPAYILGPLMCSLNLWLIFEGAFPSGWHLAFETGCIIFGA